MKNHAFVILSHKQPKLLGRIVNVLKSENHYFFINVDKKHIDFLEFKNEVEGENVTFFRESIYHCGYSHLEVLYKIFKYALSYTTRIDYIHVISGQDYPIRSNKQFDEFFENTNHSFMYIDSGDFKESMAGRYKKYANGWYLNKTEGLLFEIWNKFHLSFIMGKIIKRKEIPNYVGGWDWFSWERTVLEYVVNFMDQNPEYVKRYNHTLCPTEHLFPTILQDRCHELLIESNNPLRYISWQPHRLISETYRPFIFNELDYNYIKESKAFFCRKVDEANSAKLLDLLDEHRQEEYNIHDHTDFI